MSLTEVEVYGLVLGPHQPRPLVLLKDKHGPSIFPVGLSPLEAQILAFGSDRPEGPHGTLLTLLKEVGAQVEKAQLREVRSGRQIMELHYTLNGKAQVVETFAETGLSVALATRSPLYATQNFMDQSRRTPFDVVITTEKTEKAPRGFLQ